MQCVSSQLLQCMRRTRTYLRDPAAPAVEWDRVAANMQRFVDRTRAEFPNDPVPTRRVPDMVRFLIGLVNRDVFWGDGRADAVWALGGRSGVQRPCNCSCTTFIVLATLECLGLVPSVVTAAHSSQHVWIVMADTRDALAFETTQDRHGRSTADTTAPDAESCVVPFYDGGFFRILSSLSALCHAYISNVVGFHVDGGGGVTDQMFRDFPPVPRVPTEQLSLDLLLFELALDTFKASLARASDDERSSRVLWRTEWSARVEPYLKSFYFHADHLADRDLFVNSAFLILMLGRLADMVLVGRRSSSAGESYQQIAGAFTALYYFVDERHLERVLGPDSTGEDGTGTERQQVPWRLLDTYLGQTDATRPIITYVAVQLGLDPPTSRLLFDEDSV